MPMSAQAAAVARYIVDANLPPVDLKPLSEREQDTLLSVVAVVYELRRELREKFRTLFNGLLRLEYAYTGNEDLVSLLEREYGDP